jgi:hypothetical protein
VKKLMWVGVAAGAIALGAAAIAIRLGLKASQPVSPVVVRGAILDYDGKALTEAGVLWQAAINARAVREMPAREAAEFLREYAQRLGLGVDLVGHLQERANVMDLQLPARLSEPQMQRVVEWFRQSRWQVRRDLIRFARKQNRVYPYAATFAPLLGFVDIDGYGLEGVERQFNASLERGQSVRLGVSSPVQIGIANALQEAMASGVSSEAGAVAIDIPTGRVVALVSLPGFDPADVASRAGPKLRLSPVTRIFQAGPMLQPFLAYAVLSDSQARESRSVQKFESLDPSAGRSMAGALGYESAMAGLSRSGLLARHEIDFPGAVATHVRETGTLDERLRDIGNGAGVAPADLLAGVAPRALSLAAPLPKSPRAESLARPARPGAAGYAEALRTALVRRARRQSNDERADFGGMWAIYPELHAGRKSTERSAVLALFAPANVPRHLLVIRLEAVTDRFTEPALLEHGREALSALLDEVAQSPDDGCFVVSRPGNGVGLKIPPQVVCPIATLRPLTNGVAALSRRG